MTTAYKLARQTIRTVEQAVLCRDLMRTKLERLEQTQPLFNLFEFDEKIKHPYYNLLRSAELAHDSLVRLVKGYALWKIGGSDVGYEIDVTHAKYITDVAGADAVTVALIQAWKRRAIAAQAAADEMIGAYRAATLLWSKSAKPQIRVDIARHMKGLRQANCIEVPELDINKDCKKLVTELKKLNVMLRDIQRGKKTVLDCYKKAQTINILRPGGKDSVLDILMK
jgi:hypothetical protein